jgi:lysophospholipase L1-like esterase
MPHKYSSLLHTLLLATILILAFQDRLPPATASTSAEVVANLLPTGPNLNFYWSMPERFGPEKGGMIDYHWDRHTHTYDPSFINPKSWRVDFEAEGSAASGSPIKSYVWEIQGKKYEVQAPKFSFDGFKSLGSYTVKLTVTTEAGLTSSIEKLVVVKDILIVSVGDSFAAGQGNPDIPKGEHKAQWIYSRCHRSANAGPALAALKLERADPHTSITFISYACSGAGITDGLIGVQKKGVVKLEPQIDQVRKATAGRPINALIISIGGNDANFAALTAQLILHKDAETRPSTQKLFSTGLATLKPGFQELYERIAAIFPLPKVFIMEYPDLVRDKTGDFCSEAPPDDHLLKRISKSEAQWASQTVIKGLDDEVRQRAEDHKWVYVNNIAEQFKTHGYCADDQRWVNTFNDARQMQGTSRCNETSLRDCIISAGSVHPNIKGHRCFATRIIQSLIAESVITFPVTFGPEDLCAD